MLAYESDQCIHQYTQSEGGALCVDGWGTPSLTAPSAGAAFIQDSCFAGNAVVGDLSSDAPGLLGGAVSQQGSLLLHNCTFSGNLVKVSERG